MFLVRRLITGSDKVSVQSERKHSHLAFFTLLSYSMTLLCVRGASCYLSVMGSDQHSCIPHSQSSDCLENVNKGCYHHRYLQTRIDTLMLAFGQFSVADLSKCDWSFEYIQEYIHQIWHITYHHHHHHRFRTSLSLLHDARLLNRSQLWNWNRWVWVWPLSQRSHLSWPDWHVLLWVSSRVCRHRLWAWCGWVCQWALPERSCLSRHGEQVGHTYKNECLVCGSCNSDYEWNEDTHLGNTCRVEVWR